MNVPSYKIHREIQIKEICIYAKNHEIKTLFDAEESWIQDGVDLLVLPLLRKYNTDKVVVALTIQLYLNQIP